MGKYIYSNFQYTIRNPALKTESKLIITQRLRGKEKELNKLSNFDKLIEK